MRLVCLKKPDRIELIRHWLRAADLIKYVQMIPDKFELNGKIYIINYGEQPAQIHGIRVNAVWLDPEIWDVEFVQACQLCTMLGGHVKMITDAMPDDEPVYPFG